MFFKFLQLALAFLVDPPAVEDGWQPDARWKALDNEGLFGGDMITDPHQMIGNGLVDTKYRWYGYPGQGNIPYVIDDSLADYTQDIEDAMQQYHDNTCITFSKRKNEKNYIKIFKGTGCYAVVGMNESIAQPQPVSLGDGCLIAGTIVHELAHAVGLFHEQNRPDRDNYIWVYLQNVDPHKRFNFDKLNATEILLLNEFDYNSIMIYGNDAFSVNGQWTMEAKDGTPLTNPYAKPGLNKSDIERVNKLYKCRRQ